MHSVSKELHECLKLLDIVDKETEDVVSITANKVLLLKALKIYKYHLRDLERALTKCHHKI